LRTQKKKLEISQATQTTEKYTISIEELFKKHANLALPLLNPKTIVFTTSVRIFQVKKQ
jgi:threonine/homoserine/homoserine lactone efflux protein